MKAVWGSLVVIFVSVASAIAQPTVATTQPATSTMAAKRLVLEVDQCPHIPPNTTDAMLQQQGAEHYNSGLTLYLQGDYKGAVLEFVASYCKIPSYGYSILKDIGQAWERELQYEKAVAYLERYVRDMPENAQRRDNCSPDPKEDREVVKRRILVLKNLKAHILIQTEPRTANIDIEPKGGGVIGHATSGQKVELVAGEYTLRVSMRGFKTVTLPITAKLGTPDNYYIPLKPQSGRISVQTSPGDAKIYLDDNRIERLIGVGHYEGDLEVQKYKLRAEKQGRQDAEVEVEVKADQLTQVPLDLQPVKQFGRRQLIVAAAIGGTTAAGFLLNSFGNTGVASAGSLGGGAASLVFSYLYLPDDLALGTSNLTITSGFAGGIVGFSGSLIFTNDDNIVTPITGAGIIAGAASGYYLGDRVKIRPGDAALINSSMTWGTLSGLLFAESFISPDSDDRRVRAGLVLSGFGMGAISGIVMTRYFDISRTHAVLIDVGGVIGILGGLALEGVTYGGAAEDGRFSDTQREHLANFSLGGMAIGLITAGILTRNIDAPKLGIQPTTGTVTGADGKKTSTFGLAGSW